MSLKVYYLGKYKYQNGIQYWQILNIRLLGSGSGAKKLDRGIPTKSKKYACDSQTVYVLYVYIHTCKTIAVFSLNQVLH